MRAGNAGKPFLKGFKMLEGEHGGGRENRDLFVVNNSFEGGTHGNFRFAVADVAAEQAVHGLGAFHVVLDVADGGDLVGGLLELEGILEFALEIAVGEKKQNLPWSCAVRIASEAGRPCLQRICARASCECSRRCHRVCRAADACLLGRGNSAPGPCAREERRDAHRRHT